MSPIEEAIQRVDLSRFPIPMRLSAKPDGAGRTMVLLDVVVKDRDTGVDLRLCISEVLPSWVAETWPGGTTQDRALRHILEFVRNFVLHELDECTMVDGVRCFDPHNAATRRTKF